MGGSDIVRAGRDLHFGEDFSCNFYCYYVNELRVKLELGGVCLGTNRAENGVMFWHFWFCRKKRLKMFIFVEWWFNDSRRWIWCPANSAEEKSGIGLMSINEIIIILISFQFHCLIEYFHLVYQGIKSVSCVETFHFLLVVQHNCFSNLI